MWEIWEKISIRTRQRIIQASCAIGVVGVATLVFSALEGGPQKKAAQPRAKVSFSGAASSLTPSEVWTERASRQIEKLSQAIEMQNTLVSKKLETMERSLQALGTEREIEARGTGPGEAVPVETVPCGAQEKTPFNGNQPFTNAQGPTEASPFVEGNRGEEGSQFARIQRVASRNLEGSPPQLSIVENTLPAGSHARCVLLSAVAASTATNAPSDPRPVTLRFLEPGTLPRGWKSILKDAVLIGSCYGDLSSERVICRLQTISWVEANGEVVEKDIEGWIVGEDGLFGVRGHVVDRSGEVARASFISGVLSGLSSFFQAERSASVFPISPFGQTNALKGRDMLGAGTSSGAGKALEKLSDFYVKRAEGMSPVIMVNAGRVVDVVLKKGLSLKGSRLRGAIERKVEKAQLYEEPHE